MAAHNTPAAQDVPNPSQGPSDHRRRLRLPRVLLYARGRVLSFPKPSVTWTHSSRLLVLSLLPSASASLPKLGPTLEGRWPSTLLKVAAAIISWAFRVVMSSSDPRKPTLTSMTTCGPPKDVLLLGRRAFADLIDSIKLGIGRHGINVKLFRKQIEGSKRGRYRTLSGRPSLLYLSKFHQFSKISELVCEPRRDLQ